MHRLPRRATPLAGRGGAARRHPVDRRRRPVAGPDPGAESGAAAPLRLGPYAPAERTGPVIWLKCIVERTLPEVSPPADVMPDPLPAAGEPAGAAGRRRLSARAAAADRAAIPRRRLAPAQRPRLDGRGVPHLRRRPRSRRRPGRPHARGDAAGAAAARARSPSRRCAADGSMPTISIGWPSAIRCATCSAG